MTKSATNHSASLGTVDKAADLLANIEKAASAVVQQVKHIRVAEVGRGNAVEAHAAIKRLREHLDALKNLSEDVSNRESSYADEADRQFLELESAIREACSKRGWRVDSQWPTLYVERAVVIEISDANRTASVAGKKMPMASAEAIMAALDPLVRGLLPKGFSPQDFMRDLAAAYDSTRGNSSQLPVFDVYRGLVVHSQGARFWRDARAETFTGFSADQFRARLTAALESGITSAPDDRELRLLPPLNPKDGLFVFQPAESRYGFVGRIEFVPVIQPEDS